MEEVLADMKIFDIIIIRKSAEKVDLRFNHKVMAPLHPAQVFKYLSASLIFCLFLGKEFQFLS